MADDAAQPEAPAGRFHVAVAPGELGFVQDLLNTAAVAGGRTYWPDLLDAPDTAAAWFQAAGLAGDSPGVRDFQLLRDTIRRVLIARDHGFPLDGALPPPIEVAAAVRLMPDGTVSVAPASEGAAGLRARVLLAVRDAQLTGAWRRLKVCRNPECRVAFWDNSRNSSGVWHDVRTCGNVVNLRNSRARRVAGT